MQEEHKLHKQYGTAKAWYTLNETIRSSLEGEWREAAQLTLPYVFPVENQAQGSLLPTPFNSIGPAAVNALAAKLLLALLPPTGVFFRLLPDSEIIKDVPVANLKQLDSELAKIERNVIEYINQKAIRVSVFEAIKLLIITGNVMIYKIPKGSFKIFSPYQYVVQRDYVGNMLTSCIKERMSYKALPTKVQEQLAKEQGDTLKHEQKETEVEQVDVYTFIVRESLDKYRVWQEIDGVIIVGTEKTYSEDKLPYITLRWSTVNNEDYGRGIVSQYIGDLRSLEGLTQTIVEGAGIAAMTIFGLKPGSTLQLEDLNNASSGEFVLGDLEREVSTLQVNKGADLQVPLQLMQQLEQRLARAFLMLSGQVRDSERTTAVEVRATAAELETTLGGVFSVLASEFQTPMIRLILQEMNPEVLKFTTPSITTGISAISRERDYGNLNTMLQSIAQLGPDVIAQYLNIPAYLTQIATALGMDPTAIVKSPEQIQQEQQQAMQQQQSMMQQEQQGQMQLAQTKQQGSS